MEKLDLRYMNNDEIHVIRKQIIRLKKSGKKGIDIANSLGVSDRYVSIIWNNYKTDNKLTKPRKSGRKKGSGMLLSIEQEQELIKCIVDKTPDQYKFGFMLWTRQAIKELIAHLYNIDISLRNITNYLKRWGMTCQRPIKKAYCQSDLAVEQFKKTVYPSIKAQSAACGGEIYWSDETSVNNQEHYSRGFAPKGKPPTLSVYPRKERYNMISAINNYGKVRFMLYDQAMNAELFIDFLERLIQDTSGKVFLIVDNLRVHHSKVVTKWVQDNIDKIELYFIPPYSPELNPVEYLNHALKISVHSGLNPKNKLEIKTKVDNFMQPLENSTNANVFLKHKKVAYIHD